MALPLISLAPARTLALRSSMEPAAACAAPMNFSKFLRTWSTLASATDRISFDISKRSRTSSLMVRSFALAGLGPDTAQTPRRNYADPRVPHCGPRLRKPVIRLRCFPQSGLREHRNLVNGRLPLPNAAGGQRVQLGGIARAGLRLSVAKVTA